MNGTNDNNFTMKEIVIEIKDELIRFRMKYDADQKQRDDEMSRRPTRKELYSVMGIFLTGMGVIMALVGG